MLWLKCSLLITVFMTSAFAGKKFTSKECLDSKLSTTINHDGRFFGLLKNKLSIDKDQCLIKVKYKSILETEWVVDVCREPIHVKVMSKGSQSVYKRRKECEPGDPTDFCMHWEELRLALQDHGLIFADGEKEDISTSHGLAYCSYLILKQHLGKGILFSKYDEPANIFKGDLKTDESCELPEGTKKPENETKVVDESIPAPVAIPAISIEQKADKLIEDAQF